MPKKTSLAILSIFTLFSIVMLSFLPKLSYSSNEAIMFMKEDSTAENLPDKLLVIVKTPDIFNKDVSTALYNAVQNLKSIDGVIKVNSIFDAAKVRVSGVNIDWESYSSNGVFKEDAREILNNSLYVGNLIDPEGKVAFIILDVENADIEEITDVFEALPEEFEYHMTGTPVVDYGISKSVKRLMFIFPPALFLLMWVICFLRLGDARSAVLPPLFAALAAGWVYAVAAIAGIQLDILVSTAGLFVIVVSSSYGLHIIDRYLLFRSEHDHREALKLAVKDEAPSLFLSAITTAAGFLTFLISSMESMKSLGLLVSLGVAFSFVFSLVVIPAIISLVDFKTHHRKMTIRFEMKSKVGIVVSVLMFVLLAISPLFIANLRVNSDQFGFFEEDSEVVRAAQMSKEYFGWVVPFYVNLHKSGAFTAQDESVMKNMLENLESVENVQGTNSIIDITDNFKIPLPLMMIFSRAQRAREFLNEFIDGTDLRILIKTPVTDAVGATELKTAIDNVMKKYPQYSYTLSSPLIDFASLNTNTSKNQVLTILMAFGAIFVLLIIVFRNLKHTLIACVPIVGTAVLNFAYMGLFGMNLDIATSIVAGVLMGLIIDYSIHLMLRYRTLKKQGIDGNAIQKAMNDISPVIIASGLSLAAGFSSLFFTSMKIYSNLALLLVLGVITGVVMTLFTVPTFLWMSEFLQSRGSKIKIKQKHVRVSTKSTSDIEEN